MVHVFAQKIEEKRLFIRGIEIERPRSDTDVAGDFPHGNSRIARTGKKP